MESLPRSLCRSCRTRLQRSTPLTARPFSSSASIQMIPPESPHFVDVPRSFQPDLVRPVKEKGYLPTPKDIFPRNLPNKPTAAYIAAVTPSPKKPLDPNDGTLTELQRYKIRMANLRKSHLRSSLTELYKRKQTASRQHQMQSQMKQAESQRLRTQAPREDERLTNVSIPLTMSPTVTRHFQPAESLAMHESKMANVARKSAEDTADRVDSLHTLYMNARNFITTETQLLAKIKEVFDDNKFGATLAHPSKSIWDQYGAPDGIKQMIESQYVATRQGSSRDSGSEARYKRDQERMKRIAEKLSGGKM